MFAEDKRKALQKEDKSNKKSIDHNIVELVNTINALPDYYTTSSCSGRIVLFCPGEKKNESETLFSSHDNVTVKDLQKTIDHLPNKDVYFRQESFILHVCCKDMEAAKTLLALSPKRSGIIAIDRIMVELIAAEHFDTIIARDGTLLVDSNYIKTLIEIANKRLEKNRKKIKLLTQQLNH